MSESALLTVNEVSEMLRVDPTTCRRWIKSGALDAVTLPHKNKRQSYRIKKETLEKLLDNLAHEPAHNHAHA
jgi:excisionase family DNA binding protein